MFLRHIQLYVYKLAFSHNKFWTVYFQIKLIMTYILVFNHQISSAHFILSEASSASSSFPTKQWESDGDKHGARRQTN